MILPLNFLFGLISAVVLYFKIGKFFNISDTGLLTIYRLIYIVIIAPIVICLGTIVFFLILLDFIFGK